MQEASNGTLTGRPMGAIAPDVNVDAYTKARAQQLYAMSQQINGSERQARLQVLNIVTAMGPHPENEVIPLAESLWAFVAAGDAPAAPLDA